MNHLSPSTSQTHGSIRPGATSPPFAWAFAPLRIVLWFGCVSPLAALHAASTGVPPAAEIVPNRTAPSFVPAPAQPTAVFSPSPTREEIGRVRAFEELLVPMSGPASDPAENRALAGALSAYQQARQNAGPSNAAEVDVSAFEQFVSRYPHSVWNASLLTNLGLEYYHRGAFSQALAAWQQAWQFGQDEKSSAGAAVVDRSLGELTRMLARLGRVEELQALVTATAGRQVSGPGAEAYDGARGGLWNMLNHPEESFKCGPWALDSILTQANPAHPYRLKLKQVASTKDGVSLEEVASLAKETGMNLVPMHRANTTGTVPVPAVVHWKLGHYGALLRSENGRYLLQDPTFGNSQWITQATLDQESSGYFLVPLVAPPKNPTVSEKASLAVFAANWRQVDSKEAQNVFGKGFPSGYPPPPPPPPPQDPPSVGGGGGGDDDGDGDDDDDDGDDDPPVYTFGTPPCNSCPCPSGSSGDGGGGGMAAWTIRLAEVDLAIMDTPLAYAPPVGPQIRFHFSYEQRETNQPATPSFSNVGNKWNFNWVTTLTFDSNNAYVNSGEGGVDTFAGFTSTSVSSGLSDITRTKLVQSGTAYQLVSSSGAMSVFGIHDGSSRYYMTQRMDALGNTVTLAYDSQYRLITITDAIGQVSTLTYGLAADPTKITKITDPFGRTAVLAYDANNHLSQITDAQTMTSQFAYAATDDFIQTLTTGYGATNFTSTTSPSDSFARTLLITLPNGAQEMAQSIGGETAGIAYSDPSNLLPAGLPQFNAYLYARNTSYWDRKAMLEAPGDPTRARIYHFLHGNNLQKSTILESVKMPFENRVWYYYQGQQQPGFVNTDGTGMLNLPTFIGRVMDDGTTQLYKRSYNALGHMVLKIDPVGRTTKFVYDANGIDQLQVRQATGPAADDVVITRTYNAHHQPLTVTDASDQQRKYVYNNAGQPLSVTDAKGRVTTYIYNTNGYLQSMSGPLAGPTGQTSFAYDAFGRIRTVTDALGYAVTYGYDNLNRQVSTTYPDSTTEVLTYSLLSVTNFKDRLNRNTVFTFNSINELVSQTDPLNRTTQFGYCRCGALTSIIDALGRTTSFDYDVQGRPTAKRYPDGSATTFNYESTTSRLKSQTDSKGQTTALQYTPDNRLKLVSYNNALKPTPSVRFNYDPNYLRLTSMVDGSGVTIYTYNPVATTPGTGGLQLASAQTPMGKIAYGYDELGRLTSRNVDGAAESWVLNGLGMPLSETSPLGTFAYNYLPNARMLTAIAYPNGQSTAIAYTAGTAEHLIQQITHKRPDSSGLSQWTYGYNAFPEINVWTQQRDAAAARVFTLGYDLGDQITSANVTNPTASYGYTYDPAANRLTELAGGVTTTTAFNSLNEISSLAPPPAADRTDEWDAADRLVAINYTGTSNRTELSYDGLGRVVQIVEKTGTTVNSTKRYLWDGTVRRVEKDGTGATTKRFYDFGEQLVGTNAGNYFFALDHLGSIREMTDTTGAIRARYDYDLWGRRTKLSGDLDADFGFAGLYTHAPSGLNQATWREYDPNLGRWLNRDPLVSPASRQVMSNLPGVSLSARNPLSIDARPADELYKLMLTSSLPVENFQGPNLFAYAQNNPVNLTDPLGLWYVNVGVGGGFVVGGGGGFYAGPGGFHPYVGGGLTTPGVTVAVRYSSGTVCPGWGGTIEGSAVGSVGVSTNKNGFEFGAGFPPGASAFGSYTW